MSTDYILGVTSIKETINSIVDLSGKYIVENKFKTHSKVKENIKTLDILDKIYALSPESQEDVMKYIEMYNLWEIEKKNPKGSNELDSVD